MAPVWVNAVIEPHSPGQLPAPELADLTALALRRCSEQLEAGGAVSASDAVAAMRLAWQIEHDEAIPARDKELAEAQAAALSLKNAVIRRCGQDEWRALWGEVQIERERAREIRRVRQRPRPRPRQLISARFRWVPVVPGLPVLFGKLPGR